jgi:hypothetical protein
MHRLFVTYKGQPLVVGTEDDLITIPEPGIEVNEILGSEEVTEKIAEDVAVGDVLYKQKKGFDDFRNNCVKPVYSPYSVAGSELVEVGDKIYYTAGENSYDACYLYSYQESDGWGIDESWDFGEIANTNELFHRSWATASGGDGNLYIIHNTNYGAPYFSIYKKQGNLFEFKGHGLSSAEDFPDLSYSGTNPFDKILTPKAKDIDGELHVIIPTRYNTYGDHNVDTYIYDYNTCLTRKTTIDASGSLQEQLGMGYFNGSHWLIGRSSNGLNFWKWNASTQNWDLDQIAYSNSSYICPSIKSIETSSGSYVFLTDWQYGRHGFYKLNESTGIFDSIDVQTGTLASSYARYWGGGIFEDSGNIYLAAFGKINADHERSIFLVKYDPSTSSITDLSYEDPEFRDAYANTQTGGDGCDIMTDSKGTVHGVISSSYRPFITFIKWDSSTEKFVLNDFRQSPFGYSTPNYNMHGLDYYDFSGRTYFASNESGNTQCVFSEFITSGDPSGYFKLVPQDIGGGSIPQHNNFYENDGKLYCVQLINNGFGGLFELDFSSNKFYRIANADCGDLSSAYPTIIYHNKLIEFEGKKHLLIGTHVSNPATQESVQHFILDGSGTNWVSVPSSSGLPSFNVNGIDATVYNGEMYAAMGLNNYSYTDPTQHFMKYDNDTSSWSSLSATFGFDSEDPTNEDFVILGRDSTFFQDGTDLRVFITYTRANYSIGPSCYKYDTSTNTFNPDPIGFPKHFNQISMLRHISYNQKDYFFYSGRRLTGCFVKDQDGIIENYPISRSGVNTPSLPFSAGGDLRVILNTGNSSSRGLEGFKLSEFAGETVWEKKSHSRKNPNQTQATGIALESGSKGDTIRIQKVKR